MNFYHVIAATNPTRWNQQSYTFQVAASSVASAEVKVLCWMDENTKYKTDDMGILEVKLVTNGVTLV